MIVVDQLTKCCSLFFIYSFSLHTFIMFVLVFVDADFLLSRMNSPVELLLADSLSCFNKWGQIMRLKGLRTDNSIMIVQWKIIWVGNSLLNPWVGVTVGINYRRITHSPELQALGGRRGEWELPTSKPLVEMLCTFKVGSFALFTVFLRDAEDAKTENE